VEEADGLHNWAGGDGASWRRRAHRSLRILMRPHRSGFQLYATVCVQVGVAMRDASAVEVGDEACLVSAHCSEWLCGYGMVWAPGFGFTGVAEVYERS
jgi:hypothetical protein